MNLNGSAAIVTGAGGGIGSAIARRLADEGVALVLADRDRAALERTVEALPAGAIVELVTGDVAQESHHRDLVAAAEDLGVLRLSVLNAGVYLPGMVWEVPIEQWRLQMEVNFWGVLHGVRAVVPGMIERGAGHVIAVASGAGLVATPALGPYVASKHAVVGLMESLRHELNRVSPHVHASVVCPGNIRSPMASNSLAAAGIETERLSLEVSELAAQIRAGNDAGGDPSTVADAIVEAVAENRFWVLPQPEVAWGAVDRMERVRDGREPIDFLT
ncbi:MAG TPA: SDR family NAD(P)-dependent oxidoreductase [Microthrixaceae bacterium]|nr:SDR family NAD(P)-dependent oxidoreductase [Microthrixaceae bacterium]